MLRMSTTTSTDDTRSGLGILRLDFKAAHHKFLQRKKSQIWLGSVEPQQRAHSPLLAAELAS